MILYNVISSAFIDSSNSNEKYNEKGILQSLLLQKCFILLNKPIISVE